MNAANDFADIVSLDRHRRLKRSDTLVDPVIGQWRCRVWACLTMVDITQTAVDVLAVFNEHLASKRGKLIGEDEVMLCADCAPIELGRRP